MVRFLSIAVIASAAADFLPEQVSAQPVVEVSSRSVPELVERLDAVESPESKRNGDFEAVLQQIVKLGGKEAERSLAARLERQALRYRALVDSWKNLDESKRRSRTGRQYREYRENILRQRDNLETLTALRRIQNQPDPLRVEVTLTEDADAWSKYYVVSQVFKDVYGPIPAANGLKEELEKAADKYREANDRLAAVDKQADPERWEEEMAGVNRMKQRLEFLKGRTGMMRELEELSPRASELKLPANLDAKRDKLPTFVVALISADAERIPFWLSEGGNQKARFRFEIKDSTGKDVPVQRQRMMSTGRYPDGNLANFGETSKIAISMSQFVEIDAPGEYTVSVQYHNRIQTADIENGETLKNRILFRSKSFKMTIK